MRKIFVSGATGFVGAHLRKSGVLRGALRFGSRVPRGDDWVRFDVCDDELVRAALEDIDVAFFLVHGMGDGARDYAAREAEAAERFARIAAEQRVKRIIYLGGVVPRGRASEHLRSRLNVGRILRAGAVPCVELRAGMIVGHGSESWKICRDLAARLPLMPLPSRLDHKIQPVAIDDVTRALALAVDIEVTQSIALDLAGPEVLRSSEALALVAELLGVKQRQTALPFVGAALGGRAVGLLTSADRHVAREQAEGLTGDLVSTGRTIWDAADVDERELIRFRRAARLALADDTPRFFERGIRAVAARAL